ncbi:MAG TPA: hypothetical protein VFB39_14440 [Solirubrobacteraceae bacterium]|nr:hypothetical protein [Solirubrobacteraceae bacterium]
MALVTTLNAVLAFAVIVMVISLLVWAILTQQRDAPDAQRRPKLVSEATPATRRPLHEPVARLA